MIEHTTTHKSRCAHAQRETLLPVVLAFFFVFFFLFTLQKERVRSCRTDKELTTITKILQFVNISSTLAAVMNRRRRRPGGRDESREGCQLGLWKSCFCFCPSPPKLSDISLSKYCFLGFKDPQGPARPPPLRPRLWEEAIVHNDFECPSRFHSLHIINNCSHHVFQV